MATFFAREAQDLIQDFRRELEVMEEVEDQERFSELVNLIGCHYLDVTLPILIQTGAK